MVTQVRRLPFGVRYVLVVVPVFAVIATHRLTFV